MSRTKITHVAIRFQGVVYSLPEPNRHHDVIREIVQKTGVSHVDNDEQGFLDEDGRFLNRSQALLRALLTNQIKDPNKIRAKMLFSEDLW
jgi:hypothetical protein